jgi:hypothetical protein
MTICSLVIDATVARRSAVYRDSARGLAQSL